MAAGLGCIVALVEIVHPFEALLGRRREIRQGGHENGSREDTPVCVHHAYSIQAGGAARKSS
jgi:hypothetical protein